MLALGVSVALVAVTATGVLWLQWFLPWDGPIDVVLSWLIAPLIAIGFAFGGRSTIQETVGWSLVVIVPTCVNSSWTGAWMHAWRAGHWSDAVSNGAFTLVALSVPVMTAVLVGWARARRERSDTSAASPVAWVALAMALLWQVCLYHPEHSLRRVAPYQAMFHEMELRALAAEQTLVEGGASPTGPVPLALDVEARNREGDTVAMSFAWAGMTARARLDRLRPAPEVWVDFGEGRVARFDLATRRPTSVD
jgi:hypothetical protein